MSVSGKNVIIKKESKVKHRMKRMASLMLALSVMLSMLTVDKIEVQAAVSISGSRVASYCNSKVGTTYPAGYCLAWVASIFRELGAGSSSACCAYTYGTQHLKSTSSSNIPVGADVFFRGSKTRCSNCGNTCGHVGIYVGDGYIVHSYSGKVHKDKLSTVINWSGYCYMGWGYHGNVDLNDEESHNPVGCLDIVEVTSDGKIRVRGWMFDPDAVTKSNVIHIYVGGPAGTPGAEGHAITANTSRKDVDAVYHVGEFHGFDTKLSTSKSGNQEVYVYGINEGRGNSNPVIGHKTVNIPESVHNPRFQIEEMYVTDKGKLKIKGWAYDPDDVTKSIDFHVYIGGDCSTYKTSEGKACKANVSRKDIGQKYNIGEFHGIDIELDTKREGAQPVYLYAINIGRGNDNPEMKRATLKFPEKWTVCEHEYKEYVSNNDATCGKDGTKTAVCEKCCKVKDTIVEEGSATGNHNWDDGTITKEATEDETGILEYRCSECGEVRREIIPVVEKKTDEVSKEDAAKTAEVDESTEEDAAKTTEADESTEEDAAKTTEADESTEEGAAKTAEADESTEEDAAKTAEVDETVEVDKDEADGQLSLVQKWSDSSVNKIEQEKKADSEDELAKAEETGLGYDDDVEVAVPKFKKFTNVKKCTVKIQASTPGDIDGYEYICAKVSTKTFKKFKKAVKNADGTNFKFKGLKKVISKSNKVKFKKLKKGGRYAFAVRAFKVVDGVKYYSEYCTVKTIKVKK